MTEWYDGIVQGFILCQNKFYYVVLLAWNVDAGSKLYLIFPVEQIHKDMIMRAYDHPADWPSVMDLLRQVVKTVDCYLSEETPSSKNYISIYPVPEQWERDFYFAPFVIDDVTDGFTITKYLK